MTKLIINSDSARKINLDASGKGDHNRLKNLGFDQSGHIGFQKELTAEQIENISKVELKEDKKNKIRSVDEMTGDGSQYMSADLTFQLVIDAEQTAANMGISHADMRFGEASDRMDGLEGNITDKEDKVNKVTELTEESTDERYPSAKAVVDYVNASLVASGTLEEDVQQFTIDLKEQPTDLANGKYKELYIKFYVPTMGTDAHKTSRIFLYDQNGISDSGYIWYEQTENFTDSGTGYTVVYHIRKFGALTLTHRYWSTGNKAGTYHVSSANFAFVPCSAMSDNSYISQITALMYPLTTRKFIAGTTYEIWGVKA